MLQCQEMIDGSSIISSVWSMDNSLPDVSDIFAFSQLDLIESGWSQEREFENRFGTNELEYSEECDSLFNFGFNSQSFNANLLDAEIGISSMQTNYLYEIDSNPLNLSNFECEHGSISSQTNLSDSGDFEIVDDCDYNQPSSPESKLKHWKDIVNCHIQWSHLTSNEQASVIWGLAQYIITLSPRERGDVMKILNPAVKLSHINALTLVDSCLFTDTKFKLIQSHLKNHRPTCVSNKTTHKTSTKKKSQKRKISKINDPIMKKVEQAVKEKESGLFNKEIVVSLSTHEPTEEDMDIDIIG